MDIDRAVVICTKRGAYAFARGIWFDTFIDIGVGGEARIPYTVEQCAADWTDDPEEGDAVAEVTRTTIAL